MFQINELEYPHTHVENFKNDFFVFGVHNTSSFSYHDKLYCSHHDFILKTTICFGKSFLRCERSSEINLKTLVA